MMNLSELEPVIECQVKEMYERVKSQDLAEFQYKILRKAEVNELKRLATAIEENEEGLFNVFKKVVVEAVNPICAAVHETTLMSIFGPIEGHLKEIEPPEDVMQGSEDLPDYSFAPQEYITQVGQYLMTLPQHLEPLLLAPSKALKMALEHSDEKYTKESSSSCGDVLLAIIAEDTCALLLESVVQLPELSQGTSKQLATDIGE